MVYDMVRLPNLERLTPNHVPGKGLREKVGGDFAKFMAGRETCASQLCYAMNRGGAQIQDVERYSNPKMIKGGVPRTLQGGDGFLYIFSTIDMVVYLTGRHGSPSVIPAHKANEKLNGVEGIVAYGYRHIDIWAKWKKYDPYFGPNYYNCANDPSARKWGVFFWPLFRASSQ
ncbi:MAG: hypothetical protein J0I42_10690 [Bosea sp.]|uniref:hypothetical protein n=1 Tax=Bosea sp. (in: a-proteobacteria) TaxID=1871050 RepID=UPI001AD5CC52|nr:hypothetical protein [Bosea sp. (in: a-proteobacteria)]MBN9452402.1 hypothetical protein [Bosea sp. (in: a-proteobacteria)]